MESITSVNPSEYAPFYETYVSRVPEGEILGILSVQIGDTLGLLNSVPAELEVYRYGTGEWSVRARSPWVRSRSLSRGTSFIIGRASK